MRISDWSSDVCSSDLKSTHLHPINHAFSFVSCASNCRVVLCGRWGFLMRGDAAVSAAAVSDEEAKADSHPILGQLLRDLGYKKVYATSVASLVSVPIWERQRTLRADRARPIADVWTQQIGRAS